MAAFLSSNSKNSSAPRVSADMAQARNKFLPSIFEEKNDDKIQDFRKALKIREDDDEEENDNLVRSAIHEGESVDENKASIAMSKDPSVPRRAGTAAARWKPLLRSFSESRMDQWRSKRQGSAFVGGNRINSSISSSQRSFGIGQRKITSPGVNRARQVDVAEVIDLTNPEEVKEIARRFFQDELKMDLLDPRFDRPEDFIASLRWKAEKKFSYGELWQRRMSGAGLNGHAALMNNAIVNQRLNNEKPAQINKYSQVQPYTQIDSPFFKISYSKPKALKTSDGNSFVEKKNLTTSVKRQADYVDYASRRRRGRILNPIGREVKTSKNRLCGKSQVEKKN